MSARDKYITTEMVKVLEAESRADRVAMNCHVPEGMLTVGWGCPWPIDPSAVEKNLYDGRVRGRHNTAQSRAPRGSNKEPSMHVDFPITSAVDQLGLLQAKLAPLLQQEEALKAIIAAKYGDGAHEGRYYRVTVSTFDRETLPIATAKKKLQKLGVAARWFREHTKITPVTVIKCVARTGHNLNAFKTKIRNLKSAG